MFLQEKEYVQFWRKKECIMTAGLCKKIIWDQKIKVDFYLDHVPIAEQTKGMLCMLYLARKEGEKSLIERQVQEEFIFTKAKQLYSWTKREVGTERIVKIEHLYLRFDGDDAICSEKDIHILNTNELPIEGRQQNTQDWLDEPDQEEMEETSDAKGNIQKIEDIRQLLDLSEEYAKLYYNSFLLHSFYQYRHILIGKNFVGVPDYFYEREAIAAKMMGFPYFVKAQDVESVCFDTKYHVKMPKDGTYGYFLMRMK